MSQVKGLNPRQIYPLHVCLFLRGISEELLSQICVMTGEHKQ
jgi:hypothetical protein